MAEPTAKELAAAEAIFNVRHPNPAFRFNPTSDQWAIDYARAALGAAAVPPEPTSADQQLACAVDVWDGPYKMLCGHHIVNGRCIRHGHLVPVYKVQQPPSTRP